MNLVELCMSGAELRDPSQDSELPIDFAVSSDAVSLVFVVGWWESPDPLFIPYPRPIIADSDALFEIQDLGIHIGMPDAKMTRAALQENRDRSDYQRTEYLAGLLDMKAGFPELNFDQWIAAFTARPVRDPVSDFIKYNTAERDMAKVFIMDAAGQPIDVLVIDDRGAAAQALNDPYLSRVAADYESRGEDDRPPLADYVNWVADSTPYGGTQYTYGPSTFRSGGSLSDVARKLLSAKQTA